MHLYMQDKKYLTQMHIYVILNCGFGFLKFKKRGLLVSAMMFVAGIKYISVEMILYLIIYWITSSVRGECNYDK